MWNSLEICNKINELQVLNELLVDRYYILCKYWKKITQQINAMDGNLKKTNTDDLQQVPKQQFLVSGNAPNEL